MDDILSTVKLDTRLRENERMLTAHGHKTTVPKTTLNALPARPLDMKEPRNIGVMMTSTMNSTATTERVAEPMMAGPTIIDEARQQDTLKVAKRDGRIVDFDPENIKTAVSKAFRDVDKTTPDARLESKINQLAAVVESRTRAKYSDRPADINEIQTLVEQALIEEHYYDVAKSYTEYRFNRDVERAKQTDANEAVKKFVSKDKDIVDENANKDSKLYSTQRDLLAGAISKSAAIRMLPKDVANAHAKNDIHYHDADYSPFTAMTNCSLPDFADMLKHGFALGNAEMGSPHSIETAATQVTQIMQDVASSQYGGQTFNRADEALAPYAMKNYAKNLETAESVFPDDDDLEAARKRLAGIKKREAKWLHIEDRKPIPDKDDQPFDANATGMEAIRETYAKILTRKNIYDAMQTMEYQINTTHSTCGQTPFVTVDFGLGTSWAEREIQRAILLIRIGGLGVDHRTAIFPKLTYTIKYGLNSEPGDPNYDLKQLALECSSKRMYPDILFYENVVNITGSFKAPMGCRSFLQGWTNPETGKDEEEGRMNLGVVTVNIPKIALKSKGNVRKFWRLFDQEMQVAHHALQFRAKKCSEALPGNAPVLWKNGAFGRLEDGGDVDSLMKNSRATLSLGYIGLYETTAVFYGKDWVNDWGWDEDARDFALSIVRKMSDLCKKWEAEEGYHYSVYGTPSESLTDTFSKALIADYGDKIDGITDHDFITNSFHRPVWLSGNPDSEPSESVQEVMNRPRFHVADDGGAASKMDFEQPFLKYSAGGHIVYVEYPSMRQNLKGLEAMWDYAHKIGIDFLGTNTPIDHCFRCGYEGDFEPTDVGYKCPNCGNDNPEEADVTKRVCGYLGNPQQRPMIHGRHEELAHRKKELNGETGRIKLNGNTETFYNDRAKDIHEK